MVTIAQVAKRINFDTIQLMFAIVEISGKQYSISPGMTIDVDRMAGDVDSNLTFDKVYLVSDDKHVQVGTPVVKNYSVKAKIVSQFKDEKVDVYRYKQKVRYRKHIGFRANLTKLSILSIDKT